MIVRIDECGISKDIEGDKKSTPTFLPEPDVRRIKTQLSCFGRSSFFLPSGMASHQHIVIQDQKAATGTCLCHHRRADFKSRTISLVVIAIESLPNGVQADPLPSRIHCKMESHDREDQKWV